MMNLKIHATFLTILLFTSSPEFMQAQSKFEVFFRSKRYKAALTERDEPCNQNKKLRQDTTVAAMQKREQIKRYDSLTWTRRLS